MESNLRRYPDEAAAVMAMRLERERLRLHRISVRPPEESQAEIDRRMQQRARETLAELGRIRDEQSS